MKNLSKGSSNRQDIAELLIWLVLSGLPLFAFDFWWSGARLTMSTVWLVELAVVICAYTRRPWLFLITNLMGAYSLWQATQHMDVRSACTLAFLGLAWTLVVVGWMSAPIRRLATIFVGRRGDGHSSSEAI